MLAAGFTLSCIGYLLLEGEPSSASQTINSYRNTAPFRVVGILGKGKAGLSDAYNSRLHLAIPLRHQLLRCRKFPG